MNWKGRQMFGGRPSGIVQMMGGGMTPYPTHVMPDGTVMPGAVHGQGYEAGGLLIGKDQFVDPSSDGQEMLTEETRVLKGLYNDIIKAMEQTSMDFGTIIDSRVTQGSITRKAAEDLKKVYAIQKMRQAQKMQEPPLRMGPKPYMKDNQNTKGYFPEDFFPSGPPTKKEALEYLDREQKMLKPARPNMQAGGMVGAELFEEGDSDINNALNTMASVSNPEVPDMPASNGMAMGGGEMVPEEMTMDQGSGYEKDVMQLKELFKNEIRSYVSQSGTTDLDAYLKQIGSAYRNKLNELKDKYGVQEYDPSEELITEDFLAELSGEPPMIGMQGAGTVFSDEEKIAQQKILTELQINIPLERWLGMPEEERTKFINIYTIMRSNNPINPTARKPLTRSDLDTGSYDALTQERRENAERMGAAARAGYSSTQSRLLHHDSAKKAGEIAETTAMDKLLAEQIGDERGILGYLASANAPGRGATGKNQNLPADVISDLYGLDLDNQVNLDKSYDTLWKEQNKKNALGAANIDEEFLKFVTQYETVPPVYRAQYGAKRETSIGVVEFVPWFKAMLKAERDREREEDEKPFNALEESIKLRKQWAAFSKA